MVKLSRDIVTIRLNCGHERTWNATTPKENYGKRDMVTCKRCGAKQSVLSIYSKIEKERKPIKEAIRSILHGTRT